MKTKSLLILLGAAITLTGCSVTPNDNTFFYVSLKSGAKSLAVSERSDFKTKTTDLKVGNVPPFDLYSFTSLGAAEDVDNENTSHLFGTEQDSRGNASMKYFKYTFFVKNISDKTINYNYKITLTNNTVSSDGRYLDTILRVLIYENNASSNEHAYTVYAKKSETPNAVYGEDGLPTGEKTYKEYISYDNPQKAQDHNDAFPGFAEMFESDSVIATLPVRNFQQGDSIRYTLVAWLEGEDQQAKGQPPEGGSLKFGSTIETF